MEFVKLLIEQLPFLYFISVVLAWFTIHFIGEKSGVPRSLRTEVIFVPVIISALQGSFPGMLASILLVKTLNIEEPLSGIPLSVGYVISGLLLHRKLLVTVADKRMSYGLVGGITLLFIVGWMVSVRNMIN